MFVYKYLSYFPGPGTKEIRRSSCHYVACNVYRLRNEEGIHFSMRSSFYKSLRG